MTALSEKLRDAGYPVEGDRLYVAATKALTASSRARARELFRNGLDERLMVALLDHYLDFVARDMKNSGVMPDVGHLTVEPQCNDAHDTSESVRGHDGHDSQPARAPMPLRPVNRAARSAAAAAAHRVEFDTFRVRDGRAIGDVRYDQLDKLETANTKEARVLRSIRFHSRPTDPSLRVRDIIKLSTLKLFIEQAERSNDQ